MLVGTSGRSSPGPEHAHEQLLLAGYVQLLVDVGDVLVGRRDAYVKGAGHMRGREPMAQEGDHFPLALRERGERVIECTPGRGKRRAPMRILGMNLAGIAANVREAARVQEIRVKMARITANVQREGTGAVHSPRKLANARPGKIPTRTFAAILGIFGGFPCKAALFSEERRACPPFPS